MTHTSYAGSMKSTRGFLVQRPGQRPRHATQHELTTLPVMIEIDGPAGRHIEHAMGLEAARQQAVKALVYATRPTTDRVLLALRAASGAEVTAHIVTQGYFHDIRVEPNGETRC